MDDQERTQSLDVESSDQLALGGQKLEERERIETWHAGEIMSLKQKGNVSVVILWQGDADANAL